MTDTSTQAVQEARQWLDNLLHQEWAGDGSNTHDDAYERTESYMVGGGGPTGWLRFVVRDNLDEGEVILAAFLQVHSAGEEALQAIPAASRFALLRLCRADAAARNARTRR